MARRRLREPSAAVMLQAGLLMPVPQPAGESPKSDALPPDLLDDDAVDGGGGLSMDDGTVQETGRWVRAFGREYLVGAAREEECKVGAPEIGARGHWGHISRSQITLDGRVLGWRCEQSVLGVTSRSIVNASGGMRPGRYNLQSLLDYARGSGLPLSLPAEPEREKPTPVIPVVAVAATLPAEKISDSATVTREHDDHAIIREDLEQARQRLGDAIRTAKQFESGALIPYPTWAHVEDVASLAESAALAGAVDRVERRVRVLRSKVRKAKAAQESQAERLVCIPLADQFGVCNGQVTWVKESLARRPAPPVEIDKDRWEVCLHESRHTVASLLVGGQVERVTVGREVVHDADGSTREREGCTYDRTPIAIPGHGDYADCFVLLAGGQWHDLREAMTLYPDTSAVARHVEREFKRPEVVRAVERIAARLYERGELRSTDILKEVNA